jgi:hypothetical protein
MILARAAPPYPGNRGWCGCDISALESGGYGRRVGMFSSSSMMPRISGSPSSTYEPERREELMFQWDAAKDDVAQHDLRVGVAEIDQPLEHAPWHPLRDAKGARSAKTLCSRQRYSRGGAKCENCRNTCSSEAPAIRFSVVRTADLEQHDHQSAAVDKAGNVGDIRWDDFISAVREMMLASAGTAQRGDRDVRMLCRQASAEGQRKERASSSRVRITG